MVVDNESNYINKPSCASEMHSPGGQRMHMHKQTHLNSFTLAPNVRPERIVALERIRRRLTPSTFPTRTQLRDARAYIITHTLNTCIVVRVGALIACIIYVVHRATSSHRHRRC